MLQQCTLFPGWILSQTGGTIKVTAGKRYLRVMKYSYLPNFGAPLRIAIASKITNKTPMPLIISNQCPYYLLLVVTMGGGPGNKQYLKLMGILNSHLL